jgi:hypothetical protein
MTKQEVLQQYPNIDLILFAMFLFLIVFTGLVWRVMRKSNKAHYEAVAQMPLVKEHAHE